MYLSITWTGSSWSDTHKRFLALCGAVNQGPLPPADSTESKNLPIRGVIEATSLFCGCKSRQGGHTKVSRCQFLVSAMVSAVCKEQPCFPSNFVCVRVRSARFPLVILRPSFCTAGYLKRILRVTWTVVVRGLRGWLFLEGRQAGFGVLNTRVHSWVRLQIKRRREKARREKTHETKRKLNASSIGKLDAEIRGHSWNGGALPPLLRRW